MWFPCITENEMHYTVPFCKSLYANKFCKAGLLEHFQINVCILEITIITQDYLFNICTWWANFINWMKPQGFKKKNHASCIFHVSFISFHQLFHKLRNWQHFYTFSRYWACAGIKKNTDNKKINIRKRLKHLHVSIRCITLK